tara:strand:- start:3668 stop:3934 length:267 start_codon:yes stop_codon:yes gene_type:complete
VEDIHVKEREMREKLLRVLYSNGKELGFKRFNVQWSRVKDLTINEFCDSNIGLRAVGHNAWRSGMDQICKDGYYNRRYNYPERRKNVK